MSTKDITVNGNIFQCPTDWNVDQAEATIRSYYGIRFGRIEHNGISTVLATTLISTFTGNLVYVGLSNNLQVPK